ncbi:MAG: hypothetical protein AB9846_05535 [Tenuifilaceae bacterium]
MKYLFIVVVLSISLNVLSQSSIHVYSENSTINVVEEIPLKKQFLDSVFYQGNVVFKDGSVSSAPLNYNLVLNEISFIDGESKLMALDITSNIVYISYHNRLFIPFNKSVIEQIQSYDGDVSLFVKRTTKIKESSVTGPYGIKMDPSQVYKLIPKPVAGRSLNSFEFINDIEVDVTMETSYYIKSKGKINKISRVKDISKLFPNKKESMLNYINEQKLNISNAEDLIKLIAYCTDNNIVR